MSKLICLMMLVVTLPVMAQWVEAEGQADVHYQDLESARMRAIRDAMGQAAVMAGARVQAVSESHNGVINSEFVRMSGHANLSQVELLNESHQQGRYQVRIRAWAEGLSSCALGQGNPYQKSLAVTGFYLQDAAGANLGQLGQIGIAVAQDLVRRWQGSSSIYALDASHTLIYDSPETAPVHFDDRHRLNNRLQHAAQAMQSQYVLSGVVEALGAGNQVGPSSRTERFASHLGLSGADRARQYNLRVMLHDSYSGALVFQHYYQLEADWTWDRFRQTGFLTPAFLTTPYGREVDSLHAQIAQDMEQILACQPYMASISAVDGSIIRVSQPVASGIRPGDLLAVYRTSHSFSRQQDTMVSLTDTKVSARVVQVQPGFLVAELPVEAARLNLQADDLVVAW